MIRYTAAFVVLVAVTSPSQAASPATCQDYAESAAQQYHRARATPGCYKRTGNFWHADKGRHYGWCLSTHPAAVRDQLRRRDVAIAACDPSYGD